MAGDPRGADRNYLAPFDQMLALILLGSFLLLIYVTAEARRINSAMVLFVCFVATIVLLMWINMYGVTHVHRTLSRTVARPKTNSEPTE